MDPAPQEGALTAMASVADCAKAHFERYYDSVMPLLRHLLSSASARTHQLLRARRWSASAWWAWRWGGTASGQMPTRLCPSCRHCKCAPVPFPELSPPL